MLNGLPTADAPNFIPDVNFLPLILGYVYYSSIYEFKSVAFLFSNLVLQFGSAGLKNNLLSSYRSVSS